MHMLKVRHSKIIIRTILLRMWMWMILLLQFQNRNQKNSMYNHLLHKTKVIKLFCIKFKIKMVLIWILKAIWMRYFYRMKICIWRKRECWLRKLKNLVITSCKLCGHIGARLHLIWLKLQSTCWKLLCIRLRCGLM